MACPDFEDLVREGPAGHAARCEECRAVLDALAEVDATLEAAFAGVSAPPLLAPAVHARIERERWLPAPSVLPEILDFIGWAAVLAVVAIIIPHLLP